MALKLHMPVEEILASLTDGTQVVLVDAEAEEDEDAMDVEGANGKAAATVTRGEMFYSRFATVIDVHIIKRSREFISPLLKEAVAHVHIFDAVVSMVERVIRDKKLRNAGKRFIEQLLLQLGNLSSWWAPSASSKQRSSILLLLTRLFQLEVESVRSGSHASVPMLVEAYTSLLDRRHSVAFRDSALVLLPRILQLPAKSIISVIQRVNEIVVSDFPVDSRSIDRRSAEFDAYISMLDKLLNALSLSGSEELLEVLLPVFQVAGYACSDGIFSANDTGREACACRCDNNRSAQHGRESFLHKAGRRIQHLFRNVSRR